MPFFLRIVPVDSPSGNGKIIIFTDMKYSIALSLVPRVGSKNMRRLLAAFGSAEAVMNAGAERLTEAGA